MRLRRTRQDTTPHTRLNLLGIVWRLPDKF